MDSRMNKYYDAELENTRFHKNEELYKEINKSELDSYEVKSNTTILGDSEASIDVEKIKKILDTKYNEVPKRRSMRLEETEDINNPIEDTKEYDINVILEKAKEQKTENYEEERLKKLNATNFDILKKLNVKNKDTKPQEENEDFENTNLKNLINTIALNEKESKKNDALDILSDLKGSDNTEVLEGLKEEIDDKIEKENKNNELTNSFYTASNAINKKDFEDNDDFSKDIENNNTFLKIVIGLIIVIFVIGVILLIKTIYFS